MQPAHRICTHDGAFHADDVFAVALLTIHAEQHKVVPVVRRSRLALDWDWADVVVDVGSRYQAPDGNNRYWFDHHQVEGAPSPRPVVLDGAELPLPFAAVGLVWAHYADDIVSHICGKRANQSEQVLLRRMVSKVIDHVAKSIIMPIDAMDNGAWCGSYPTKYGEMSNTSLGWVVSQFGPVWKSSKSTKHTDECFAKAVAFAQEIILRTIYHGAALFEAASQVRANYSTRCEKRILVLPDGMPWKETLLGELMDTEVLFVVCPGDASTPWIVNTVPTENPMVPRKRLPEAWAGLREEDFNKATGFKDTIFCHKGRFIAGARSYDTAYGLALDACR